MPIRAHCLPCQLLDPTPSVNQSSSFPFIPVGSISRLTLWYCRYASSCIHSQCIFFISSPFVNKPACCHMSLLLIILDHCMRRIRLRQELMKVYTVQFLWCCACCYPCYCCIQQDWLDINILNFVLSLRELKLHKFLSLIKAVLAFPSLTLIFVQLYMLVFRKSF